MRGVCFSFLFMENLNLVVLTGKTGCGKTKLLRSLNHGDFQVLDLEKLSCHNGSAFGLQHRSKNQHAQKEFVQSILLKCSFFDLDAPVLTEWKGRNLGSIKIPDFIYSEQITSPKILIERSREARIAELVQVYRKVHIRDLYKALFSLRHQFEEPHFNAALEALQEKDERHFVKHMLDYYDQTPEYARGQHNIAFKINWETESEEEIKKNITEFLIKKTN